MSLHRLQRRDFGTKGAGHQGDQGGIEGERRGGGSPWASPLAEGLCHGIGMERVLAGLCCVEEAVCVCPFAELLKGG